MHPAFAFLEASSAPRALAGPVDDLAEKAAALIEESLDQWVESHVQHYADVAYNRFRERFEGDKKDLADTIVADAKPGMQKAVGEILGSADVQARLGTAQDEFKSSLAKALFVTALGTAVATWALVTYVHKP